MSSSLSSLAALAVMTEFLTQQIKDNVPYVNRISGKWIAVAIGIALCFLTSSGALYLISGYIKYPFIDYILTGLIISRGSGVIHDLIDAIIGYSKRISANS